MYDRRLDAVLAAGELGSFGKAAQRMHISTPALVKQVNAFEHEHHLVLFTRSRSGVCFTAAGESLAKDAQEIRRLSEAALRRAREAMRGAGDDVPVRLGMSVLRSARTVLDLWQRSAVAGKASPGIRLELVPFPDDFESFENMARHLGQDIDVLVCAYVPQWWEGVCNVRAIGTQRECLAVPLGNSLSVKTMLAEDDLAGQRIRVLKRGRGGLDGVRDWLESCDGAEIVDIDCYELSTFNECAESGDLLVSKPIWDGVHPALRNVPVDWQFNMDYGLLYPLNPTPTIQRFVSEISCLAAPTPTNEHSSI